MNRTLENGMKDQTVKNFGINESMESLKGMVPDCIGCGACANICPRGSIEMVLEQDGFHYPHVKMDACTDCGSCLKVCPVVNADLLRADLEPPKDSLAYGAWLRNEEIRSKSSSGGMFTALAEKTISDGGVVVGCRMEADIRVRHAVAETMEELAAFRGSKYIQSETGMIYREIRKRLSAGVPVLFVGTPCQVYALHSFLRKPFSLLTTVDLACHGTPSIALLDAYVKWYESQAGEKMQTVFFRGKETGWLDFCMRRTYESGRQEVSSLRKDYFMKAFLQNLCLCEGCYTCRFTGFPRASDLTLADFWGVERLYPDQGDWKDGVSLVLVNSDKGQELFGSIQDVVECYQADLEGALKYNTALLHPCARPEAKDAFMKDLPLLPLPELIEKYLPTPPPPNFYVRCRILGGRIKRLIRRMLFQSR